MSQLAKKIKYLIFVLLFFGCNMEHEIQVDESVSGINNNVTIIIPRLNPYFADLLTSSNNTRAYFTADKLVLRVFRAGSLKDTLTYNIVEHKNSLEISLALSAGVYRLEADVYNLKNSTSIPVVTGSSVEFSVVNGERIPVNISMTPKSPESIILGTSRVLDESEFQFTVSGPDEQSTGTEHWFKFRANSDFTSLKMLNNNHITSLLGLFPSMFTSMFDVDGVRINGLNADDSMTLYNTVSGQDYFVCVIPVQIDFFGEKSNSDVIEFVLDAYNDENINVESAKEIITGAVVNGIFTGVDDIDYFKAYLTAGEYIFESDEAKINNFKDSSLASIQIKDPSVMYVGQGNSYNSIIRNHVKINSPGWYTFEVSSKTPTELEKYVFDFQKIIYSDPITPSANWIVGEFTETDPTKKFYKIKLDPSKEYVINWDDSEYGSGSYDGTISFKSYLTQENTATIDYLTFVSSYGDGYSVDHLLSYPSNEIIIEVDRDFYYHNDLGSFAFKIEEHIPVVTTFSVGESLLSSYINGEFQYYSVSVDDSKEYKLTIADSNNPENFYKNIAYVSAYSPDRSEFYLSEYDHFSSTETIFTPKAGTSEVILKVSHHMSELGTIRILLEEVAP